MEESGLGRSAQCWLPEQGFCLAFFSGLCQDCLPWEEQQEQMMMMMMLRFLVGEC